MNPLGIVDKIQTHVKLADQSLKHFENGLKLCNAAVRNFNKMLNFAVNLGDKLRLIMLKWLIIAIDIDTVFLLLKY